MSFGVDHPTPRDSMSSWKRLREEADARAFHRVNAALGSVLVGMLIAVALLGVLA